MGVGIAGLLTVTRFCGPTSGVTVVAAKGPGFDRLDVASGADVDSGVLSTVLTIVLERRAVTVCIGSLDCVTGEGTDATRGVPDAVGKDLVT